MTVKRSNINVRGYTNICVTAMANSDVCLLMHRIGVKAWVEKGGEPRKAEVLSIQTRKGDLYFYLHYQDFNKVSYTLHDALLVKRKNICHIGRSPSRLEGFISNIGLTFQK